ncbi:phenol hydroxylase [Pseudohalioglobus sediminis]|uniref:Phenol hydroxylase n=1 Tax=Pseudohalioglobus sediminis TaxID=2606449 RepID=A0A5B0X688_9GAMM|nr:phenol hydroxylase subunit [Pseudohalioglobus sediminis]KAA1194195.1 phenol hydroxylase [Pseudohalioglobus sediminis]
MVPINKHPAANDVAANFDSLKRYVRIRDVLDDKFVEFDFAIGDPSLYVELVLPKAAFDAFCKHNRVEIMTQEQADAVDADMEKWRYGEDHQRQE